MCTGRAGRVALRGGIITCQVERSFAEGNLTGWLFHSGRVVTVFTKIANNPLQDMGCSRLQTVSQIGIENNKLEIPVITYLFLLIMETIFCK